MEIKGLLKNYIIQVGGRDIRGRDISQNMIFDLLKSFINKESKYICNKNNIWFWCAHIQGLYYRLIEIWYYSSRGRRVRQKNARKPLCANCSKENIFNLFNKPPNKFWKYSAAVKLQFWVGHYLLSLYLFNIVWNTRFSSLGGDYVLYKAIILMRLFLFLYWYIFEYI